MNAYQMIHMNGILFSLKNHDYNNNNNNNNNNKIIIIMLSATILLSIL